MSQNSTKKVVIVGTAFPLRGGIANYNERIARAYQQAGYEVKIFTFSLQYPSFLFPGTSQYSDEPAPKGLDIEVALNSINPLSWIKLGLKIRKLKPDLLLMKYWLPFMAPALGTVARLAKSNGATKVVSIIDNIIPHEKRPGDHFLSQYFINSVHAFVCMSQSVVEDMKMFKHQKPVKFNPHPIYDNFGSGYAQTEARNQLHLPQEGKYLLFFGFIRDYKGLDLLLKAMSDSRIKGLNIKLLVAGEFYTDAEYYHKLIAELNLESSLILATDFIPDSKVGLYFSACDMVVQPYKTATQSGVTQIAYHFEKPMLVTRVGGLPEIVPHGQVGYVVDIDPLKIADAIVDFYQNDRKEAFIENCKIEKKKYSWEQMLATIESLNANQ